MICRAPSQPAAVVGLALEETVDHAPLKVLRTGPVSQVESGVADGPVDPVDVEGVLHDTVADAVAPTRARAIAHKDDLGVDPTRTVERLDERPLEGTNFERTNRPTEDNSARWVTKVKQCRCQDEPPLGRGRRPPCVSRRRAFCEHAPRGDGPSPERSRG